MARCDILAGGPEYRNLPLVHCTSACTLPAGYRGIAIAVLREEIGKHDDYVFTFRRRSSATPSSRRSKCGKRPIDLLRFGVPL